MAYLTYVIQLLDLEPYPRMDSEASEPTVAALRVDEGGVQPTPSPYASALPSILIDG